jgi:hypothetical protein
VNYSTGFFEQNFLNDSWLHFAFLQQRKNPYNGMLALLPSVALIKHVNGTFRN